MLIVADKEFLSKTGWDSPISYYFTFRWSPINRIIVYEKEGKNGDENKQNVKNKK